MGFVSTNVTFKCLLGAKVQEIILGNEFFQLRLNVRNFAPAKFELV